MEQQTIDGIGARLRHSIDASRLLTRDLPPEGRVPAHVGTHGLAAMAEQTICELLHLLDEHLSIRAAFVARQTHDGGAPAAADEAAAGSGIGVPIRLADGYVYGMLCFFRTRDDGPLDDRDVRRLQMSARVAARMIDGAYAHGIPA